MSNVTYVFDVDDTICRHKNRDYANAEPIVPVIDKIRELRENGCTIVLYTARGQVSCKGDLALIEERNRDILETWLKRHDVPYDKLLFGKPLGDFYVDDKAVNLEDFLAKKQQKLTSGSGATVTTDGDTVVKKANNVHEQNSWYNIVKGSSQNIPVPKVKSLVVDTLYMSHIPGVLLCEDLSKEKLFKAMSIAESMRYVDGQVPVEFNFTKYVDNLLSHSCSEATKELIHRLNKVASYIPSSFSHGDLSLSNMIWCENTDLLYVIDPNFKQDQSSWLLDLAKIRFSLTGYEKDFLGCPDYTDMVPMFDRYVRRKHGDLYREIVTLLSISFWVRLHKYRKESQEKIENTVWRLLNGKQEWY